MRFVMLLLVGIGILAIVGCDQLQPPAQTPKPAVTATPVSKCSNDHRFERTEVYPMNMRADIALDSCTGQICKTWAWVVKSGVNSPWKTYEDAPLCKDVAAANP